jgi:hypothetical protein
MVAVSVVQDSEPEPEPEPEPELEPEVWPELEPEPEPEPEPEVGLGGMPVYTVSVTVTYEIGQLVGSSTGTTGVCSAGVVVGTTGLTGLLGLGTPVML